MPCIIQAEAGGGKRRRRSVEQRHHAGTQIDCGKHHVGLAARRGDDHIELVGGPRAAGSQGLFLRADRDADPGRDANESDEKKVGHPVPAYRGENHRSRIHRTISGERAART